MSRDTKDLSNQKCSDEPCINIDVTDYLDDYFATYSKKEEGEFTLRDLQKHYNQHMIKLEIEQKNL